MRRRLTLGAIAVVSTCTLLTGCGSSSSGGSTGSTGSTTSGGTNNSSADPKTEFTDAFQALTAGQSLTTTLGLDTDSANLIKLSSEGSGTPLTQTQADLISSAKISIAVQAPAGKTLAATLSPASATATGSNVRVTGSAGGTTYFTFTVVNKNIYAQVDLKGILNAAGQPNALAGITSQASSLPSFVQAFLAGKTVEIPASTISSLTSLLEGAAQGQGSSTVPSASQIQALAAAIKTAVLSDVTVSRTATGSTDVLEVSGNVHDITKDILRAVSSAIPAAASAITPGDADTVPDQVVKADASVTGGTVSKIEFDAGQFSPGQKDSLPIAATFSTASPSITAPSGATVVNFQDLVSFFTSFAGSTG